ncbi:TonB-dependent receptor [Paraneptunicella aestuarii]|uniref:TonB-dependent receptor plug domain-containing protein n=1 Tax=Paraneptunicella aestuarii TaxID=2831148 RepID=UPI001E3794B7|nr:TonB-dependent receptor [Paraneptunicella aestuarii]UAA38995.1 TonB-dependent receptor [Paraneptunicella aestuarii]
MSFKQSLISASVCATFVGFSASAISNETASTSRIETISVVSSRVEQPVSEMATSVSILTEQDIAASGQIALADTLRTIASVNVSNSGGLGQNTALRIRGEEGFRTHVLIDGIELSDPSAPQVMPLFDDILTSQVERVEVLRGTQGLLYGADAGGVIRITSTTAKSGTSGGVQVQAGKYSTQQFGGNIGYTNEDSNLYLAVTRLDTDGFNAQAADTSNEADGYENTTAHFKGAHKFTEQLSASLVIRDVDTEAQYDGCYDNATFAPTHDCVSKTSQQTSRLALDYAGENQHHSVGFANTDVDRDFFSNGAYGFGQGGTIQKLDYLGSFNIGSQRVIAGAEIKEEDDETQSRKQRSAFAEYQFQYDKTWFNTAGVRYDNNDTFGGHTSFRLSSAYLVNAGVLGDVKLKASYGTGFRAPSLFEQSYNDGAFAWGEAQGLQLKEETSKGFDLGVEFYQSDMFFGITYFKQDITDEIIFDPVAYQGYLQTAGTSKSEGLELDWRQNITASVELWGNYTYNETETAQGDQRLRRPRHMANLGLSYNLLDNALQLNAYARAVQDAIDIGGQELDDYTVLNLSALYELNAHWRFNAKLDNVTNREYQEVLGYNSKGRSAYVGVSYQF